MKKRTKKPAKARKKVSRSIPTPVRCMLWGRAAGRCEFDGCNKPVYKHSGTQQSVNTSQVAHIIGFSDDGPRGEREISAQLAGDIENLMLLCGECHPLIDKKKRLFPVPLLRGMKQAHERRIRLAGGIRPEKSSQVLLYGANVGQQGSPLTFDHANNAMFPDWYPEEPDPILLGLKNSSFQDRSPEFWRIESDQLKNFVSQRILAKRADGNMSHVSIFAFAPQPLLILLGTLITDIQAAQVYQLHREPPNWRWQDGPEAFEYILEEPTEPAGEPALVISFSGTIVNERVRAVLPDATLWRVTVPAPGNDFLKSKNQLGLFRKTMRSLLDRIKARHQEARVLHVFPAMPVATAVELGRIWMPKADLPLRVYDEQRNQGGFVHALDVGT